jgi:hypothetical protein
LTLLTCDVVVSSASASYYLPAYATLRRAILTVIPVVLHIRICDARLPPDGGGRVGPVALPVKALKAGQEDYWLDQIARNREEYFSGRGESPGRFMGSAAAASGLEGVASAEQVRAMFRGLDPATGEQRCAPLPRADPRSKLAAGPLLEAVKGRAAEQGVEDLEALAASKALKGDMRSVEAACRLGGAKRVKVETVERLAAGPGYRPPLAVRGGVRQGLAASRQAGQRAGAGL